MIISLKEAQDIDKDISLDDLLGIEEDIRRITNNNFQNTRIRYKRVSFISESSLGTHSEVLGLKPADTIEINYSGYNDGLYTVLEVFDDVITVEGAPFIELDLKNAMITKVEYPAGLRAAVRKLIQSESDAKAKKGIESESYARMKITYAKQDSNSRYDFLSKYQKMRW